jgi:hypothetical protein
MNLIDKNILPRSYTARSKINLISLIAQVTMIFTENPNGPTL